MYTYQDLKKIQKPVLPFAGRLFDPIAEPLVLFLANYTRITPTMLNWGNIIISLASAYYFYSGEVILGAILFAIAFLCDCMDGNLARMKFKANRLGMFMEVNGDKIRVMLPLLGLTHTYYLATNDISIFYWAFAFISTNLFFPFAEAYMGYQSGKKGYEKSYVVTDANAGAQFTTGKLARMRNFLRKRRFDIIYTGLDQEVAAILIFPLLSYFSFELIKWGFIFAAFSYTLWVLIIRYPRQIKNILEEDRKN